MLVYKTLRQRYFKRDARWPIGCERAYTNCCLDYIYPHRPGVQRGPWERICGNWCRIPKFFAPNQSRLYPGLLRHTMTTLRIWAMDENGETFEQTFEAGPQVTTMSLVVGPKFWYQDTPAMMNHLPDDVVTLGWRKPTNFGNPHVSGHTWKETRISAYPWTWPITTPGSEFYVWFLTQDLGMTSMGHWPCFRNAPVNAIVPWSESLALLWESEGQKFLETDLPLLQRRNGLLHQSLVGVEAPT